MTPVELLRESHPELWSGQQRAVVGDGSRSRNGFTFSTASSEAPALTWVECCQCGSVYSREEVHVAWHVSLRLDASAKGK